MKLRAFSHLFWPCTRPSRFLGLCQSFSHPLFSKFLIIQPFFLGSWLLCSLFISTCIHCPRRQKLIHFSLNVFDKCHTSALVDLRVGWDTANPLSQSSREPPQVRTSSHSSLRRQLILLFPGTGTCAGCGLLFKATAKQWGKGCDQGQLKCQETVDQDSTSLWKTFPQLLQALVNFQSPQN